MVSTVRTSHLTGTINPKCGPRHGLAGNKTNIYYVQINNLLSTFLNFCIYYPSTFFIYTYRLLKFGGPKPYRPVEDLAFAVTRFIQNGGAYVNYYMVAEKFFHCKFLYYVFHFCVVLSLFFSNFSFMEGPILVGLLVVHSLPLAMTMMP